jgi:hypothetical protein
LATLPGKRHKSGLLAGNNRPGADEVKSSFEDEVRFYDPGENWSGVECSACGADAE